jgi:hypothetical protein
MVMDELCAVLAPYELYTTQVMRALNGRGIRTKDDFLKKGAEALDSIDAKDRECRAAAASVHDLERLRYEFKLLKFIITMNLRQVLAELTPRAVYAHDGGAGPRYGKHGWGTLSSPRQREHDALGVLLRQLM